MPLSYDSIKKGVHRRKYLEIDPKFAAELNVLDDTEVRLHYCRLILNFFFFFCCSHIEQV